MFTEALGLRLQGYSEGDTISRLWSKYPRAKVKNLEKVVRSAYAAKLDQLPPVTDPKAFADDLAAKLKESRLADIVAEVELRLNALNNDKEYLTIHEWLRRYKHKGVLELILLYWIAEAVDDDTVKLVKQRVAVLLGLPLVHQYTEQMDLMTGKPMTRLYLGSLWLNETIRKMINRQILHKTKMQAVYRVDEPKRLEREGVIEERFKGIFHNQLQTQERKQLGNGRGRPATGKAKTDAERAKEYRRRKSVTKNSFSVDPIVVHIYKAGSDFS